MVIPIVHKKRSKKRKLLVITALFLFALGLIIAWNDDLIIAMGYRWLEWFTLAIIIIYAGFVVYSLIASKESIIGILRLGKGQIEIIIHNEYYAWKVSELDNIQIVIEGYKGEPITGGKSSHDGMGNLIVFKAPGRTHIYEFFMKSALEMNEMVDFFKRNLSPDKLRIIRDASDIL